MSGHDYVEQENADLICEVCGDVSKSDKSDDTDKYWSDCLTELTYFLDDILWEVHGSREAEGKPYVLPAHLKEIGETVKAIVIKHRTASSKLTSKEG